MIRVFDLVAVAAAHVLAVVALVWGVTATGGWLMYAVLRRGGYVGLMADFAFQEVSRSPRKFWARMFWGAKEEES